MKRYEITLNGMTPMLHHMDNVNFSEKVKKWCKAPENKGLSVAGDDRSPAWTWLGYLYHDRDRVVLPADNIMTMLREGGAKVVKSGKETYKKYTQSGIVLDKESFAFTIGGREIPMDAIRPLLDADDFADHLDVVEKLGFELLVKRAKIGAAKHVRVRPLFRDWQAVGTITVVDPHMSGLDKATLEMILKYAGALCGLGDWRPSSGASGQFGRFEVEVKPI